MIKGVQNAKRKLMERFDCDETGTLEEYVGCKLERKWDEWWLKFTQPVMLQSLIYELGSSPENVPVTLAIPGSVLVKGNTKDELTPNKKAAYKKGVGKLLHMMRWSHLDILNAIHELSRFISEKGNVPAHSVAMNRIMNYCVGTPEHRTFLKPDCIWDGDPEFEFVIGEEADSDYAKDPETRKSVSGYATFLCGAPVTFKSRMQ